MPTTEGLPFGEVSVWYRRLTGASSRGDDRFAVLLDDSEQARSSRFLSDDAREQFVVGRTLLRTTLSRYAPVRPEDWRFEFNKQAKPKIATAHEIGWLSFNLSHTRGMVVCAVCRECEIGVDVEPRQQRCDLQIAERFFAPAETAAILQAPEDLRSETFAKTWTLKEAVLKARGMGLSLPLSSFEVRVDQSPPQVLFTEDASHETREWRLFSFALVPDFQAAVALYGACQPEPYLTLREWQPV